MYVLGGGALYKWERMGEGSRSKQIIQILFSSTCLIFTGLIFANFDRSHLMHLYMLIIFLSVIFVVVVVFILYSVGAVFIDSRYEVQRKNLIAHCNKKQ